MGRSISMFLALAILAIGQNEVYARATLGIVNGTDAEEDQFPYMVQLIGGIVGSFVCGGSVIGQEWILTAGHCVREGNLKYIAGGGNQLYGVFAKDLFTNRIKESFVHPKYTLDKHDIPSYDVGLLKLEKPLEFSDKIQPTKLPDNENVPFHVFGNLTGWGTIDTDFGYAADYLQKISLRLLNDQECTEKINGLTPDSFKPAHHLCSDDYWNGECYGDSGGPFVINGTQYGVVSWSFKPCGSVPGAYSRISNPEYRNWIRNVTGI